MKVLITAPHKHLKHVLDEFDFGYTKAGRIDAWICNPNTNAIIDQRTLYGMSSLKYLITPSTGTNHIDMDACESLGIKVLSLLDDREGLNTITASSEFTFMLILMALKKMKDVLIAQGGSRHRLWHRHEDTMRGHELSGKKVGVIGYGRIGKNIAGWCVNFGAATAPHDPYVMDKAYGLRSMFQLCDIVVICCSLTDETEGMIDRPLLESMKKGAILVNTARGEIVNEQDLVSVLRDRKDILYATDVIAGEPTNEHINSPLLSLPNTLITPHIAGTTFESQEKAMRIALTLLEKHASTS